MLALGGSTDVGCPVVVREYAFAALLFGGHLAYGANGTSLALAFSAIWFIALALVLSTDRRTREALERIDLRATGLAFCAVLVLTALSLTPWAPGGANSVWKYASGTLGVVTIDPYATIVEIVKLLALSAAFLVGAALCVDDDRASGLLRAVLVAGMLYSLWALVDHANNPRFLFGLPRPFDPTRLSASFGSANTAATLFGALTLLDLGWWLRIYESNRSQAPFHISHVQRLVPSLAWPTVALALSGACLVETVSRAGLAATACVGVIMLATIGFTRSRLTARLAPLMAAAGVAALLLLLSLYLNSRLLEHRFEDYGAATTQRGELFDVHLHAFLAAPWSGYGLGTFTHVNAIAMRPENVRALDGMGAAHNVYIQWLEEAGLFGAFAMFATVALIAVDLGVGAARRKRARNWLFAILAVLGLFALHGASDYALQVPSMALFLSLLLGLGVGLTSLPRRSVVDTVAAGPLGVVHEARPR